MKKILNYRIKQININIIKKESFIAFRVLMCRIINNLISTN